MARIFISYKRADKDIVFPLKDKIEAATGENCWIDLDDIESDAQFAEVIIKNIDAADIVLFMYSHHHKEITDYENDWTVREINYAKEEKKRIVFINLDKTPFNGWFKFMFPQKQVVDASSESEIQHMLVDLQNWLGKINSKAPHNAEKNNKVTDDKVRSELQIKTDCNNSKSGKTSSRKAIIWCVSLFVVAFGLVAAYVLPHYTTPSDFPNEEKVKHTLEQFAKCCSDNDFKGLKSVYAPTVLRYHNIKKAISRDEVIQHHRNYDTVSGVCGRYFNYRWDSLKITKISKDRVEVICVMDYSIYRVDETKPKEFVIEQHTVMDDKYRIVSIYDNQLSKQ